MFVTDIRKDFYEKILHKRVLVLVSFDVDALCACKILQALFHCDSVQYTLVPVAGKVDWEQAFAEHAEQLEFVVMINCGATQDIIETLQPEENVTFYVCDSHRPMDLVNVYNDTQVKMLMSPEDAIPKYEDIFRDEESDDEDNSGPESRDSDGSEPNGKRRRYDEDALERKIDRRRKKREWGEKRNQLLFEYEEFSGYGQSAAMIMYDLAWKMSKDTNDLLWWAIVGLTDQLLAKKVDRETYVLKATELNRHVARHNHRGDEEEDSVSINTMRISFTSELQLALYRHWSLFESLRHSSYTACNLKLWTLKGFKKLHEFLADMGIPLSECKQKFSAMDMGLKDNVTDWLVASSRKFGLEQITMSSFHAQYGFKNKFCAFDVAYAVNALLESVETEKTREGYFLEALDCLSRSNIDKLTHGLELSKRQLRATVSQVQSLLDMSQVISAGSFLYAFIQEGTPDTKYFSRPNCLGMLARFTLEAHVKMSKNKKARALPLVMTAPLNLEAGTLLVIGIPPLPELEQSSKNFFGRAFEQAGQKTGSRILHDNFDSSVIEMKSEDRSKFFDALISLLT